MVILYTHHSTHLQFRRFRSCFPSSLRHVRNLSFPKRFSTFIAIRRKHKDKRSEYSICCLSKSSGSDVEKSSFDEDEERPPFDINLAVILAGFAFEAYTSPPENTGRIEVDAAGCKSVYLSESFIREIYDGQLFIKLKKGFDFPAMDPWGTSDPYVIFQLNGQVAKSNVKWGTKEPTWNEEFTFNIKYPPDHNLQVAAWDANLVTPHKRMGNAGISLEHLADGNAHEVLTELEGMGGGGKVQLEMKYKSFDAIEEEKKWWTVPFLSEFLKKNNFDSALKMVVGSETVPVRQFVEYAFGQLKSLNDVSNSKNQLSNSNKDDEGVMQSNSSLDVAEMPSQTEIYSETQSDSSSNQEKSSEESRPVDDILDEKFVSESLTQHGEPMKSDSYFWKDFADIVNKNAVQSLGLSFSNKINWDEFDLLNSIGLQSRKAAEEAYIKSGLASPKVQSVDDEKTSEKTTISAIQASIPDIRGATQELQRQTDSILGALMVLTATVPQLNMETLLLRKGVSEEEPTSNGEDVLSGTLQSENLSSPTDSLASNEKKAEEMRALFSTAESAMEAWAMLSSSLGNPSFIKSEFEKICFLDNEATDTQVAIWRDSLRRRLVVAFRGTEQARWKDLRTDLMLIPSGLNPERIGGDFKQEVQVHTGFLSAYDSVRIRIISLIKTSIGYKNESTDPQLKWRVYVTGHSLGGALATLLALELSTSQLVKHGAISLSMYNFGSPRVGNRRFADLYNEKVKDSWRVVNHRDIIPNIPRLMGYCHVAQPVYLATGEIIDALENIEVLQDGYEGDMIGEATPDVIVSEVMKGEKELIEKILQTEINIFRSIRDGSALMQHMEDFYYITLLEKVRFNYGNVTVPQSNRGDEHISCVRV